MSTQQPATRTVKQFNSSNRAENGVQEMAQAPTFEVAVKIVQKTLDCVRLTREQRVKREMEQIQRENEAIFLERFREDDYRALVALTGEQCQERP